MNRIAYMAAIFGTLLALFARADVQPPEYFTHRVMAFIVTNGVVELADVNFDQENPGSALHEVFIEWPPTNSAPNIDTWDVFGVSEPSEGDLPVATSAVVIVDNYWDGHTPAEAGSLADTGFGVAALTNASPELLTNGLAAAYAELSWTETNLITQSTGSYFDPYTGRFTAPEDGWYTVTGWAEVYADPAVADSNDYWRVEIRRTNEDGPLSSHPVLETAQGGYSAGTGSGAYYLLGSSDWVSLWAYQSNTNGLSSSTRYIRNAGFQVVYEGQ